MSINKFKLQTFLLTVPSGQAVDDPKEVRIPLASNYSKVIGYAVEVISGSSELFEIGFKEDASGEQILDYTFFKHLTTNEAVPVKERYHEANFEAKSKILIFQVRPIINATTSGDIKLQIIFKLEK